MTVMLSPFAESIRQNVYRSDIDRLLKELFPICRSITGHGVRRSFEILSEFIPLNTIETPSGARVFDWTVPDEWNIRDAYIKNSKGERVVDFNKSNLHVVGYSESVRRRMSLAELKSHLHTLPEQPEAIPYLTSYYKRDWGFCLTRRQFDALIEDDYEVCIDSDLKPGLLLLAETVLPGETEEEIFFSTYGCHPSVANNELSGPIMMAMIYKFLSSLPTRKYTYRFYIGPETIGALVYLNLRGDILKSRMKAGYVLTCCGDRGSFTYKQGREADNTFDRIAIHTLNGSEVPFTRVPFFPTGSDERQYCSPGFNLPVGSLMRSMYGKYPEYHTSLDNLDFVTADSMLESFLVYLNLLYTLERNVRYLNLKPFGEPMLGQYGLYDALGGKKNTEVDSTRMIRYLLNYSDGKRDLLDIAELFGKPLWEFQEAIETLISAGLIAHGS